MIMENTKFDLERSVENKAKFIALHWGQKIALYKGHLYNTVGNHNDEDVLELKPLSDISDEDLILCLTILGTKHILPTDSKEFIQELRNSFIEGLENPEFYGTFYPFRVIKLIDFLRSRGYALPWMGLSVEELINRGWIKLLKKD